MLTGNSIEGAIEDIGAAEEILLEVVREEFLLTALPEITHRVRTQLPVGDPRRSRLEAMQLAAARGGRPKLDRDVVISAIRAANLNSLTRLARLRSFRNILLTSTALLFIIAGLIALVLGPTGALSLCFSGFRPEASDVCPSGSYPSPADAAIVESAGILGAALTVVAGLRHMRGSVLPFALPLATSLLKLATGAIAAVTGLLLMIGGFVPGLGGLDSSAQIIAWAILFGCSQQLFTRLVDQRAQILLQEGFESTSEDILGELSTVIDQRLEGVGARVSQGVGDVVVHAMERSLRGPELTALNGGLSMTILNLDHTLVGSYPEEAILSPGKEYIIRVHCVTPARGVRGWEKISVPGRVADMAQLRLVPESEEFVFEPRCREVNLPTTDGHAVADFEFRTPSGLGRCPMWVTVYQYSRLVHVLRMTVLLAVEV
ncbi:hypothetical protein ACH47C_13965 [Streptomyces rishiriensis]|uniref:hypothetical protein n=1 Tax=Streptomyces rishiriensis TaxID=68264 RepID=UPI0033CF201E